MLCELMALHGQFNGIIVMEQYARCVSRMWCFYRNLRIHSIEDTQKSRANTKSNLTFN